MPDSTHRLRLQARRFENRLKPTATRYSAAFRIEVLRHARARIAEGVAIARIAGDLGLRPKTLTIWLRAAPPGRLRRVRVDRVPGPPPTPAHEHRPVVVTPAGFRVEGLDVDGVVRLLRSIV